MNNIQQTDDYSSFKRIEGNRGRNKGHVQKLYNSFNENPDLAKALPIIVNDNMEIIDGQHRFEAWKKLGLPIYFHQVIGLRLQDVQTINSATKNWRPLDFAKSHAELGNENYKIYLQFHQKYHFVHKVLMLALTDSNHVGGGNTTFSFNKGKLVVDDIKKAHLFCQRLTEMQRYYKRGDTSVFALAYKKATQSPGYDHNRMMSKTAEVGYKFLIDSPKSEDYLRQLEKIYNYHMGNESRVRLY